MFLAKSVSNPSSGEFCKFAWLVARCIVTIYCGMHLLYAFLLLRTNSILMHLILSLRIFFSLSILLIHQLFFFYLSWPHTLSLHTHAHTCTHSIFAAFPSIPSLPALHTSVRRSLLSYLPFPALTSCLLPSTPRSLFPFYPCSACSPLVRSLPPSLLPSLPPSFSLLIYWVVILLAWLC